MFTKLHEALIMTATRCWLFRERYPLPWYIGTVALDQCIGWADSPW